MTTRDQYTDKLNDPRWRSFRLEVLETAGFACERCHRHSTSLVAHHRRYVRGREPWDYPLAEMECLCDRCHSDEHDRDLVPAGDVRAVIGSFAKKFSFPRGYSPAPGFDVARISAWARPRVETGAPQRAAIKFAGWLWNTGTRDMDMIVQLLEEALRRNPASWYAYFAPGGPARQCRTDQAAIARAEAECEAHKAADRAFLARESA